LRPIVSRALIAAACLAAAVSASAQASSPVRLLDIPYIQQSEALCGGAAAAMVMRYWGAPDVRAETFEALVDRAAGGIRAQDLLDDLRRRGWRAESFRGDRALMAEQLNRGQPLIALIEDRPGAFHFVVVAARANGRIVYHDPARAPYRVVDEAAFDAAWEKSDRWTMLLLPGASEGAGFSRPGSPGEAGISRSASPVGAGFSRSSSPVGAGFSRPSPCEAIVREAVAVAGAGDKSAALRMLASAGDLCPGDSAPHRETAGIHALAERWPEAVTHARAAVARDPGDRHAWQIVAAGEYVGGDPRAALDAWNAAGEPRIDLVTVQGLTRTRHSVASTLLDLPPDVVLTSQRLAAAEKRLGELPAADVARVNYRPQPGGRANVEAMVVERPLLPTLRSGLIKSGIGALIDREVSLTASSPTGGGETIRAAWRWWEARRRLSVAYAAPSPLGVLTAEVFAEKQAYGGEAQEVVESRRGGHLSLASWTSRLLRWEIGGGLDAWGNERTTAAVFAAVDQRLVGDRVSLSGSTTFAGGSFTAWTSGIDARWRSQQRHEGLVWLANGGLNLASPSAPLAWWSGAGTGHGRAALLRAHPLLDSGRVTGDVFGRRLYHASAEVRAWMPPVRQILRLAPALFVDAARATRRRDPGDAWHVDAGIGLRFAAGSSVLRVDVAKGLRDGATAFSLGWSR
jgi:hypothetical protein